MLAHKVREVLELLGAMALYQQQLLSLVGQQQTAIRTSNRPAIDSAAAQQQQVLQQLQGLLQSRARLLAGVSTPARPLGCLRDLVNQWPPALCAAVQPQLERVERLTTQLQRECWVLWVMTNRAAHYCGEVLELIAHRGERPGVYTATGSSPAGMGGAVLNTLA